MLNRLEALGGGGKYVLRKIQNPAGIWTQDLNSDI